MKVTVRQIVIAGVMSAIAIFLGASHLGFIPFLAGTAITIMHVPVIIGAVLEGPLVGVIIGALFGIFSLIQANVAPTGPGDLLFRDPLVSIFPRLFIGLAAYYVYALLKRWNKVGALGAAALVGTLTNTVLVLGMIGLRRYAPWPLLVTVGLTNGPLEIVAAILITLAVVIPWQQIETGRGKRSLE